MSINNPQINSSRSAFLLDIVSSRQANIEWIDIAGNVGTYGWFAGGETPASVSTVDRIDFANDSPTTASPRGPLSSARRGSAATGNANYAWVGGGYTSVRVTIVDRIDFSNDSPTTSSPRGPLTKARNKLTATSNTNYGWWVGGADDGGNTPLSSVDRIDFSNDSPTAASPRGPLSAIRYSISATANANFGWFGGGWAPGRLSLIERIDFSNDTVTASPRGPLTTARNNIASVSNSNYGWFAGGYLSPSPPADSTVDRIDFANDSPTAASPRGLLSAARAEAGGAGNSSYGWFAGSGPAYLSSVDRIDFSNDSPTTSSPRGPLTQARGLNSSGVSNYVKSLTVPRSATSINPGAGTVAVGNANFGWFAAGSTGPTTVSIIDRIDFANDSPTVASRRGPLGSSVISQAAAGNANYGWFGGGVNVVPATVSTVDRIDFANDSPTTASPRGPLSSARRESAATGNANYGWFSGGLPAAPGVVSTVDRIDFSNDSPTIASPRGPLLSTRYNHAATGNVNYGWWVGGTVSSVTVSRVDRIDFANDSPVVASFRGPLSAARNRLAATSNANYGWFGGGVLVGPVVVSTVDRIDFSNDSPVAASPRGTLSLVKFRLAATGNANYGWFGGGGTPTESSQVDRIDFSNDSPTAASPRGPLSAARYAHAASSNYVNSSFSIMLGDGENYGALFGGKSYGWIGGGGTSGGNISQADRIDFSNDSPTIPSRRGIFSSSKTQNAAAGNANYGWWGLARLTPSTGESTVERLDFSNDLVTASVRGLLSLARGRASAVATNNYGWWTGGKTASAISTVDRVDFSNDSPASASPRGPLSAGRYSAAATGNANYGWIGGGGDSVTVQSIVDRIDFANDSPTSASLRSPLTTSGLYKLATGNTNYGWFSGGYNNGFYSSVDRINFANDTVTPSVRGNLTASKYTSAASGNANYGWIAGGTITGIVLISTVERIDYSNDSPTSASSRGPLSAIRGQLGGTSNYVKTSYVRIVSSGTVNSGTTAALNINFSIPQYAKTVNSVGTGVGTYGWFGGGSLGPSNVSTVDRIDFSNDSPTSASRRGPLSLARYGLAATGNANYGWFGGGFASGYVSIVDRIDFSNDSPTAASPRGPLSAARYLLTATGNANYGQFIGGSNSFTVTLSTVDRIDFANDSPTSASPRGPLRQARGLSSAVNNANYGWTAGGSDLGFPTRTRYSTVDRIDFANDSPTAASPRGPLSFARDAEGGVSNSNYGWFGGGFTPGPSTSSVDRIDFSNDSPTAASPRGPLGIASAFHQAAGNADYGWFAGGNTPVVSRVQRIDFSNDSPTAASVQGPLSSARNGLGASSNYVK